MSKDKKEEISMSQDSQQGRIYLLVGPRPNSFLRDKLVSAGPRYHTRGP